MAAKGGKGDASALAAPEFESPEYDALFEDAPAAAAAAQGATGSTAGTGTSPAPPPPPRLQEALEAAVAASTSTKHLVPQALSHALQNTVDLTLESALTTIDMLFPARDDAPVTQASLVSGSWDPEPAPEPAAVDSWLRATIPETTVPKQSYMLTEFLRGSPSMRRSDSKRGGNPRTSVSGLPGGAAPPRSSTASPVAAAAGGSPNSRRSSPAVPSPPRTAAANASRKQQLTPEQAAAEARLREELEVRRAQQAVLAEQEAKDAEARARVQALGKELRGKEYSYDHRGKVVPLAPLPADGGLLSSAAAGQAAGPQFAVRTPTPTQGAGAGGAKGRKGGQRAGKHGSPSPGASPEPGSGAPSSTAPSPLPGAQPHHHQQQGGQQHHNKKLAGGAGGERRLVNDFKETQPRTQPNTMQVMTPTSGVTLRGSGASKSGPTRAKGAGLGMSREEFEQYAQRVAHQQQQEQQALRSRSPTNAARASLLLPPPSPSGSAAHHAAASSPARRPGQLSPLQHPTLPPPGAEPSSGLAAAPHAQASAGSSYFGPSGSFHQFSEGVLAQLPASSSSVLEGATLRAEASTSEQQQQQGEGAAAKPQTHDVNAALLGAPDWGRSAGAAPARHPALETSKPTAKDRELELGRNVRLPRDRVNQATSSPPLSPAKLPAHVPVPRMTFAQ